MASTICVNQLSTNVFAMMYIGYVLKCMHEFQMRRILDGLHLCFGKGDASYCTY